MNILITGAFGFVGRNLSAWLAEHGHKVVALDIARQELKAYGEFYSWDELERIPWKEVDAVVHLAGKAHDTRNASDPQSYFDVNVGLTKKVVAVWMRENSHRGTESTEETCDRQSAIGSGEQVTGSGEAGKASSLPAFQPSSLPIKKFILFSSVKAVADRVEGVLTEEAAPDPQTPYGQSKLEAEEVVRSALSRGSALRSRFSDNVEQARSAMEPLNQSAGRLNYYILRPCMIHGPGNKGNLNLLYGLVRKGVPWPLGGFENRRSFASIGNVCVVVDELLKGDVQSGVYQVADDEAISTNELVGLMAEVMGRRARVWRIPAGLVRAAARAGDVLRLPLNSERLKKLTESYVVSNAKVKRALGWKQMPVGARTGMRTTLESFGQPAEVENF